MSYASSITGHQEGASHFVPTLGIKLKTSVSKSNPVMEGNVLSKIHLILKMTKHINNLSHHPQTKTVTLKPQIYVTNETGTNTQKIGRLVRDTETTATQHPYHWIKPLRVPGRRWSHCDPCRSWTTVTQTSGTTPLTTTCC